MTSRSLGNPGATNTLAALGLAERLFIWGFRSIGQFRRLGWPSMSEIQEVYRHFAVADAVAPLDAMFEVFACTARREIELHCPGCAFVSEGEYRLLQTAAAAQQGLSELARDRFKRWLPEVAADWIMLPICRVGQIFVSAGLILPARQDEPSPVYETMRMRSWSLGTPTLH